ncbi:hypothetical protein ACFSL4_33065 [Streptomyces caeni]|uniref:Uncharacterized protein n=1 Tax=Streptomyces caeni TaxID=2307231 RepID=A0ABW4J1T3_9ACTN
MPTRTFVVAAAVVGAAALATTGITYASIADSSESATSGHRSTASVQPSAQRPASTSPPLGDGTAHGQRDDHRQQGHSQQGHSQASSPQQGHGQENGGQGGRNREGRDGDGRDGGRDGGRGYGGGHGHEDWGRIYFNDRTYSAHTDGCVTAASGLGSSSFSVFNDSRMVIEIFRGFTCDNGAPVATVGPHGTGYGVVTRTVHKGVFGDDGVVGSFRVIDQDDW